MKIYTKTGDAGMTGLFSGERVSKTHPRVDAYGDLDELNSVLGVAASSGPAPEVGEILLSLQKTLFELGSDLATVPGERYTPRIHPSHIAFLESEIDRIMSSLPTKRCFILPGGTVAAAQIHVARTICRRVERKALAVSESNPIPGNALVFLNRLSDFLYVLARYENALTSTPEPEWWPEKNNPGR